MDIKDKYTAKSGKFKGLKDDAATWHDLYLKGGEELLREFSEHMLTEHDFFAERNDGGLMGRLCVVVTMLHLTLEQAWFFAFKRLPPSERFFLAFNRHCPGDVLEAIWFGEYFDVNGVPDPEAVAWCAYFNNYRKALAIYARRPDIRAKSSSELRKLYDYSLSREGLTPLGDEQNYSAPDFGKVN